MKGEALKNTDQLLQGALSDVTNGFNAELVDNYEKFGTTTDGRWTGKVVDNDDPDKLGRIKILIFGFYDELPKSALPWAVPDVGYIGGTNGSFIIPEIGTFVRGYFDQGDIQKPIYDSIAFSMQTALNMNSYKINNYDNLLIKNRELNNIIRKNNSNYKISNSNYEINEEEINNNNFNNENLGYIKVNENDINNISMKDNNYNISKTSNRENDPEFINNLINMNKYLNSELDKLKKELYLSSKQNTSNKEILANYIQQILGENKDKLNTELVGFLLDRIDKLEYQNFYLASKLENYILILNKYLDELCEYIDIIYDMRDVINDIPSKFYNEMTQDFFIVKNAINEKNDLLNKKYEEYNIFKNVLNTDDIMKNNAVFLMIGNKINDVKNLINNEKIPKDYSKILDEKIKQYENLINSPLEDENKSIIEKKLIINNDILEKQNSELRQLLKDIYSTPLITGEIKEKLIQALNEDTYNNNSGNPFSIYEDLLMMLNVQCSLNEAQLNHN